MLRPISTTKANILAFIMRQRSARWYRHYFNYLEQQKKNTRLLFKDTLQDIQSTFGRVEPSFASKLVATIRPETPVYDSVVLRNLGIKGSRSYAPAAVRFDDALRAYEEIQEFHEHALSSKVFPKLKSQFDRSFSQFAEFTDAKKLDFLLWQWRDRA